jgi:hypothetical protein
VRYGVEAAPAIPAKRPAEPATPCDFDPGTGQQNRTSAGNENGFVLKLSANGTYLWARAFGGTGTDDGAALAVDGDRNAYVGETLVGTAAPEVSGLFGRRGRGGPNSQLGWNGEDDGSFRLVVFSPGVRPFTAGVAPVGFPPQLSPPPPLTLPLAPERLPRSIAMVAAFGDDRSIKLTTSSAVRGNGGRHEQRLVTRRTL